MEPITFVVERSLGGEPYYRLYRDHVPKDVMKAKLYALRLDRLPNAEAILKNDDGRLIRVFSELWLAGKAPNENLADPPRKQDSPRGVKHGERWMPPPRPWEDRPVEPPRAPGELRPDAAAFIPRDRGTEL